MKYPNVEAISGDLFADHDEAVPIEVEVALQVAFTAGRASHHERLHKLEQEIVSFNLADQSTTIERLRKDLALFQESFELQDELNKEQRKLIASLKRELLEKAQA